MSDRKPLLSDSKAQAILRDHNMDFRFSYRLVTQHVRDFYEHLITSGKLRVVEEEEEVEFASNDYDCLLACTGCNWKIGWHIMEDIEPMKFCPGCRRKIKQDEQTT